MAKYAEACIAVQKEHEETPGTQSMIRLAKKYNLKLFEFKKMKPASDYEYKFQMMEE